MENADYYEITSQLDAREILRYLNQLGIQNINGEVLKLFIKDLKKLIKYDLAQKHGTMDCEEKVILGPERLHSASTFSSRLKSRNSTSIPPLCSRQCQRERPMTARVVRSAPNLGEQKIEDKPPRRACSCIPVDRKPDTPTVHKSSTTTSNNLIKVPKQPIKRKCDPVSLYHYYISQWAKYKPNVPGENNWAELRWNIRQKMVGSSSGTSKQVIDKENLRPKKT
ncbi:uncharacterized protein LOC121735899 [Aricia agestis]|uniref:uncharacterized protein LOC121735899 n=1 Tax=Aricia agestis TaxID=91739 RepID=UPI001C208B70|nr:uncharacterized protein LOC121735899 [Aricia agestis]